MTDKELLEIAGEFGTPSYVFDTEALVKRMKAVKDIVGDKVHLCYSIKANPFLIKTMLSLTEKLEVCSPGELDICKALKVDPDRIIYSGVVKRERDVKEAAEYKVGIFTAESKTQAELINKQGISDDQVYPVLLRLNAGSQFGMSKEDLVDIISNRADYSNIDIKGIHYFVGTGRAKIKQQIKELGKLKELFKELKSGYGFETIKLEYGPGLNYPYFEGDDFSDTLRPLKELAPELQSIAEECELTIEMGRFFASECGYYLTRIEDIKTANDTNYAFIDGGINHINYYGQIMGMKVPVIHQLNRKTEEKTKYAIAGSLCTTGDIPVREVGLCTLEQGDVLAFCNIGAYSVTEGIYLFLSRALPNIIIYEGEGKRRLVRGIKETSIINMED
ncbi:MAG: alanine racemase [Lachnospiraceae bacterium]|nr:alanine racemase [Lachnospiraceae bacterium]